MTSSSPWVLLSIQREHARRIYSGEKKAELRKSFSVDARCVFLYETAPVSSVTGAFIVRSAGRLGIEDILGAVGRYGVTKQRARKYFGGRKYGWMISAGPVVRFREPIEIAMLRQLDHCFRVPQAFAYLRKFEAVTEHLRARFVEEIARSVTLSRLRRTNVDLFGDLIRREVGSNYDDIDEDFVSQVLSGNLARKRAFSTQRKQLLELQWKKEVLGFAVITQKAHGSWKTGPSILLPQYRGIGLGQMLRQKVETYCARAGARAIYCTCSAAQPEVVSYLLNAGMQFQARLKEHLAKGRDELVFSKELVKSPASVGRRAKMEELRRRSVNVQRIGAGSNDLGFAIEFFVDGMPQWYFAPAASLGNAIRDSLCAVEGESARSRRYSDKVRSMYALYEKGQIVATVLVTMKRSRMAKLNLVAKTDREGLYNLVVGVCSDLKDYRRLYITVPITEAAAVQSLHDAGFRFEGLLRNPFNRGVDHACWGYLPPKATGHS